MFIGAPSYIEKSVLEHTSLYKKPLNCSKWTFFLQSVDTFLRSNYSLLKLLWAKLL